MIADLVSSRQLEENVVRALESVRLLLGVPECAIWLHTKDGLVRSWGAGESTITASQVRAALASAERVPDSLLVVAIGSADRPIGALAVRATRRLR